MKLEYWVVYERLDDGKIGASREVRTFRLKELALIYAESLAHTTPFGTSVDWTLQEITRRGRECIDANADIAYFPPAG